MKLTPRNTTAVQSLGRQSAGTTGLEGETYKIKKISETINNAADTSFNIANKYQKIKTERQKQQSSLFKQKEESEFWKQYGGKEFFKPDELPDEVITDGMRTKGKISSAEILPLLYENFNKESIPRSGLIIEDERARNDWTLQANQISVGKQTSIQTKANQQIERQIFSDQKTNWQNAIDQRRPDIALQIANDMNGSATEIKEFKLRTNKASEIVTYEDLIIQSNIEGMRGAIEHLKSENEIYDKNKGSLDSTGRVAWISKLESELSRLNRTTKSTNKANLELLKREIKITQENSLKGKEVDPESFEILYRKAVLANAENKGTLTSELKNLEMAAIFSGNVNIMNKADRDTRLGYIEQVKISSKFKDFETKQLVMRLEAANKTQSSLENKDLMKAASDSGFIKLSPININTKDFNVLSQQLLARKRQFDVAEQNYGEGIGKGLFTKNEALAMSGVLNEMSVKEQMNFLTVNAAILGNEATDLYGQLNVDGNSTSFTMAGLASLNGNMSSAEAILRGNAYKRENAQQVNAIRPLMNIEINSEIKGAFFGNPKKEAAVREAVLDAYVFYAKSAGKDLDSIEKGGMFGDDLFAKAIEAATGGMLDQSGRKIPTPEYGMNQDTWDDWLNTISPLYIDSLGGIDGYDSAEFLTDLNNDDIILEEVSQGKYAALRSNGVPLAGKDGNVFILTYSGDAERKPKRSKFDPRDRNR